MDRAKKPLPKKFYARDTLIVARDLLGKILHVDSPVGLTSGRIVETEAYQGDDPASHSSRGETPRTSVMFGEPGFAYVYFIYGMYEMLNFVTEPKGQPGAVLIRAVEPLGGQELMRKRRKTKAPRDWTNGPGKLCRAMGVAMDYNRSSLQGPQLFVTDDGFKVGKIKASPRVGISQGKDRMWRFFIDGNEYVSRSPLNAQAV